MKYIQKIICTIALWVIAIAAMSQQADSITQIQNKLISRVDSLMANYKFEQALSLLAKGDSLHMDILLRIGQCNFRLGTSAAAIRPYEHVLQLDSTNLVALNQLGQLYAREGDFAKALASFTRLIELDPTNSYYCKQAGTMAARMDNNLLAKSWFRKALNFNPADAEAHGCRVVPVACQ